MTAFLHIQSKSSVALLDALAAAGSELAGSPAMPAAGLLYSPQRCEIVRMQFDGQTATLASIRLANGLPSEQVLTALDVADVIEARVFSSAAELRWVRNASGGGRDGCAALLQESPSSMPSGWTARSIATTQVLEHQYPLRGRPTDDGGALPAGWARLAGPLGQALFVPVPAAPVGRSICLLAREYCVADPELAAEHSHGNVVVMDERLIGFA